MIWKILCHLIGHQITFVRDTRPGAEDAHYRCRRCGLTWDYYF